MIPPVIDAGSPQGQTQAHTQTDPIAPPLTPIPPAPATKHPHETGLLHALQSLIYLIVIAIFIITFTVQPFRIPSGSMESTLLIGDFLLVNKQSQPSNSAAGMLPAASIHRGDIVVFHYPIDPSIHLIKRVIGLPGDHLKLRNGRVYINGTELTEPYAIYRPAGPDSFRDNFPRLQNADPDIDSRWWIRMRSLIDNGELIIPADNYFVLGDNRNDSEDSRYWGFVPRETIVGKPFLIYFSLQQRGSDGLPNPTIAPAPPTGKLDSLLDFARWSRTFQVVR
jgi:signal peptidase I